MSAPVKRLRLISMVGSFLITGAAFFTLFNVYAPHLRNGSWPVGVYPEPSEKTYPVRGIDISHHNGDIDFEKLRGKIDFVYLKATEGATWRDPMYDNYYEAAKDADIPVGAYHFFKFNIDGRLQAENFLWQTHNHSHNLPPVIDVETETQLSTPDRKVISRLTEMITALQESGVNPIIYTHRQGVDRFIKKLPATCRPGVWISSFTDPPLSDSTAWIIWQYSNVGTLPGIKGHVDLNAARTDDFIRRD